MSERAETRHLPVADAETAPYWEAAREGRLLLRVCEPCARPYHYPRSRCPRCWSDQVSWQQAGGGGTVYSYTVVRQNGARPFRDELPYVVAIIELDEGPRLLSAIDGADPSRVTIGARVQVSFRAASDEVMLPVFELEEAT